MNFGITQTATTSSTNINKTESTTLQAASVSTTPPPDRIIKDPKTLNIETQNLSEAFVFNNNSNITVNPSKLFTTPQNSLEILSSLQNSKNYDNNFCEKFSLGAVSRTSTIDLPGLTSLASNVSEEAVNISNVKLDDLGDENNLSDLNNYLHIQCATNTTFASKTESNLSQSGESLRVQTEESIGENIDWDNTIDFSLSTDQISINSESTTSCGEGSLNKLRESCKDELKVIHSTNYFDKKSVTRLSERAKKKSWYNVLYPNYKSRSQDFKKLFKEVPNSERLIVDYSCALYRDLLIQGRLYISQNYVCFHANILGWETCLTIKWADVTSITKEKTALVIPNAILICTPKENYFFSSFTTRDKTFLILFRVWQNTLMNKPMLTQEIWQLVHNYYGDELGLTTDDEDYVDPTVDEESVSNLSFLSTVNGITSLISVIKGFDEQTTTKYIQHVGNSSASDNNSGDRSSKDDSCSYIRRMKTNAKELTLISAKPEDGISTNAQIEQTSAVNVSSGCTSATTTNDGSVLKDSKHNTSTFDTKRKVSKNNRQREENINKNSEALPTDVSDSSDSEDNNIPFVATAECNSPHEGRQLVHTILPINIETLFNLLFSKSKFLLDFHAMRKSTDLVFNDWIMNEDGLKTRTFNVTVQLAASVGPKTSKVTEFQVMRDCSKAGELYSIDINNVNAGIPYADSFSVLVHYCLVKTVDDHTMLSVHAQIKYKKSIWGVVKGFIEKNTWAGLDDFYTSLLRSLQSETCIPPAKGKGRRPRRGTATQIRPLEEIPILLTNPDPTELCGIVQTISTRHLPESPILAAESTTNFRWLSLFVLVLLCFLIIVNVILLLKLWKLEDRIDEDFSVRSRLLNFSALKQLPNNHQDWVELLRQQEVLHKTELKKWQTVLQTAIELLKKTERTLVQLMLR